MNSAKRNDRESPLLRLPVEIRNKIYTYVFRNDVHCFHIPLHGFLLSPARPRLVLKKPASAQLALLSVCRKVYRDAALLPFSLNLFVFDEVTDLGFLRSRFTAAQRQAIARICLVAPLSHLRIVGLFMDLVDLNGARFRGLLPNVQVVYIEVSDHNIRLEPKPEAVVEHVRTWTSHEEFQRLEQWFKAGNEPGLRVSYVCFFDP